VSENEVKEGKKVERRRRERIKRENP